MMLAGMKNAGNSCFVTATLCVIGSSPLLTQATFRSTSTLAKAFQSALAQTLTGMTASPMDILLALHRMKPGYNFLRGQQCVSELLEIIMIDSPELKSLCTITTTKIETCIKKGKCCPPFQDLNSEGCWRRLPRSNEPDLQRLLTATRASTSSSMLSTNEPCSGCGATMRVIHETIPSLPPVLIIEINRFMTAGKDTRRIRCPPTLIFDGEPAKYALKCVILHHADSTAYGHYTASIIQGEHLLHVDDSICTYMHVDQLPDTEKLVTLAVYEIVE